MKGLPGLIILMAFFLSSFLLPALDKPIVLKTADLDEFVDTNSCLLNKKGEIFVFAPRAAKIFKFQSDGSFEKSFCRRGEGPGEIIRVFNMFHDPFSDHLLLPEYFSQGKGKITIFDGDGNFKGLKKVDMAQKYMDLIQEIIVLKDGSFYLTTSERVDWKPEGKLFVTQEEYIVRYFKANGDLVSRIYKGQFPRELTDRKGRGGPVILFAPRYSIGLTAEENLAIIRNDENTVNIFNKEGKNIRTFSASIKKADLSDEEFNAKRDEYAQYFISRNDAWMASLVKQMIKLEYKPLFLSFFITRKYVVLTTEPTPSPSGLIQKVIFFDLNGRLLGQKVIGGRLVKYTDDYIIVFKTGDDENDSYRIEPNTFSF